MFVTAVRDADAHHIHNDSTVHQQGINPSHITPISSGIHALVVESITKLSAESKRESNQATTSAHNILQNISDHVDNISTLLWPGTLSRSELLEAEGLFNRLQQDFQRISRVTESLKLRKEELSKKMNNICGRITELKHILCAGDVMTYDKSENFLLAVSAKMLIIHSLKYAPF